jgi:DinB family protein
VPPLESLRATVPALVALVTGSPVDAFHRRPAPGEWTAATVVGHLADAELVHGVRLRIVLTAAEPVLTAYDEGAWATRFGPLDDDPTAVLARFRVLRDSNIAILETLTDQEWHKTGHHEERGQETVAAIVDRMVAHDSDHLDQIRAALAS